MKSAVLMSGHFRNFEKSHKEFKKILPDSDFYAFLLNHGNIVEDSKNPNSVDDLENTVNKLSKKNKFYYSFILHGFRFILLYICSLYQPSYQQAGERQCI